MVAPRVIDYSGNLVRLMMLTLVGVRRRRDLAAELRTSRRVAALVLVGVITLSVG